MLNSGWLDLSLKEYLAPNCLAEAAKEFGVQDDRVRLALTDAALRDGKKIGDWQIASAIAAKAGGLDEKELLVKGKSADIEKGVRASTAEFHSLLVTQRPTFVLENNIGDRVVFSGIAKAGPIAGAIDAMLEDAQAYAAHAAHFGTVPKE